MSLYIILLRLRNQIMSSTPSVIDFFCGAGGFSEGFRQQGFRIVMGVDNWRPAVETHNLNHHLKDSPIDILKYEHNETEIDALPDTDLIVGSPPCVDFSMSNKAGKAHKGLGIRLIETYLRIVAVKKYQKNSRLKAWLMENVPNSRNFVQEEYTFKDLGLTAWARRRWPRAESPEMKVALKVKENGAILNAADYGSPQTRQRFVCGEIIASGEFPFPVATHNSQGNEQLQRYTWLGDIRSTMPSPRGDLNRLYRDPNYPQLEVSGSELTDHFYDSGLYQVEWEKAKLLKVDHPFMGRMAFPEVENRPSRTIMATRSGSTRESIIYRSEFNRVGDGEYRLPTIREAATLMGFPFSYQFVGGESTKWRLIGNAVCPHLSFALGSAVREKAFNEKPVSRQEISFSELGEGYLSVDNLNDPKEKDFKSPPKRNRGARFRRHAFKIGNMTVALTNYLPTEPRNKSVAWHAAAFLGAGDGYKVIVVENDVADVLRQTISLHMNLEKLESQISREILSRIPSEQKLQELFEENSNSTPKLLTPSDVVEKVSSFISGHASEEMYLENVQLNGYLKPKMPVRQILAAWAFYRVVQKARSER